MITITKLHKQYGKKILFDGLSLRVNRDERIGLIVPNGAGKTTLFAVIRGETETFSGQVHINRGLRIGYLPQEAQYHSQRTVLRELAEGDDRGRWIFGLVRRVAEHWCIRMPPAFQRCRHEWG